MGVTVHFEGALAGDEAYSRVLDRAREFAASREWQTTPIACSQATLTRVRGEENWDYEGPTRGIQILPHPNCDPLRLEFDENLYVQEYCKTQFAPSSVHIDVVEYLRKIQPELRELLVEDEGEYWETEDPDRFQGHLDACFQAMDELLQSDPNLMGPVRAPNGRILDLVSRD